MSSASIVPLDPRARCVLGYWFGRCGDDAGVFREKGALWFARDAAVDAEIAERFGDLRREAIDGALDAWRTEPLGRLALVVLVDQFSRNLFRDDARAFEHDALARAWLEQGLQVGADRALRPVERTIFYLPLQHAESIADQLHSVALFTRLRDEATPDVLDAFQHCLDYAVRHRDIIARFGRFPHRNAALGRASTADEIPFLREPGSSF